nr:MAG TPA: hypothetical protein [Caudoviricetes sp.]
MERLTSTRPWSDAQNDLSNEPGYGYIWQKLQRYEETGLEPEEIERILDSYGRGMTLRTENAQRLEIIKEIPIDRLRELAQAEKEGRLVVLDGKSKDKELIRELMRLLYWLEDCIKKKDFSPFRIVAGAPENNYPFINAFQRIENKYELEMHFAAKAAEAALNDLEAEHDR